VGSHAPERSGGWRRTARSGCGSQRSARTTILGADARVRSHATGQQVAEAVHAGRVATADGRHLDDLSVEEFHPVVLVQDAQLPQPVVHIDGEGAWEELYGHGQSMGWAVRTGQFDAGAPSDCRHSDAGWVRKNAGPRGAHSGCIRRRRLWPASLRLRLRSRAWPHGAAGHRHDAESFRRCGRRQRHGAVGPRFGPLPDRLKAVTRRLNPESCPRRPRRRCPRAVRSIRTPIT
jgi:hypothetical protein